MSEPAFPRWPLWLAVVALLVPALDLLFCGLLQFDWWSTSARTAFALGVALFLYEAGRGSPDTLRTLLDPAPNWWYWVRLSWCLVGIFLIAIVLFYGAVLLRVDGEASSSIPRVAAHSVPEAFNRMCIEAPLVEEVNYRLALVGGMVSLTGRSGAILASGIVFAGLHWIYGNASIENQVAGFILAWAYLRSGTLVIPILIHAVGNLMALDLQLIAYHVLGPG